MEDSFLPWNKDDILGRLTPRHLAIEYDEASINVQCAKKRRGTYLCMKFSPGVLNALDIQPKFLVLPKPSLFFSVRGGTIENAAFLNIRHDMNDVKKILLELDVTTGKATLKAE